MPNPEPPPPSHASGSPQRPGIGGGAAMKVVVTGADGFIGRHIAFALRAAGHQVVPVVRNARALRAMGFEAVAQDLTAPEAHVPGFWEPLLQGAHLVWCAGLLTGSEADFAALHQKAPAAALAALGSGQRAVLISAVGIETAETGFARWRRQTEALFQGQTILRPGLVLADTSYGGSSLVRAMAALPWVTPVVGEGSQPFNPIHAADLAQIVLDSLDSPPRGMVEVGGPQIVTQAAMIQSYRRWLGLPPARVWRLPLGLARAMGRIGDALRLGPVSATAVAQLQAGVLARGEGQGRSFDSFVSARPAGTQDLWQARLYLLKPLIRLTLAVLWLASGLLGLFTPGAAFVPLMPGLPEPLALLLARAGGVADLALGLALLRNLWPKPVALAQIAMVLGYTVGLTLLAPGLLLDPFGSLLKNLAVLALLMVHRALVEER